MTRFCRSEARTSFNSSMISANRGSRGQNGASAIRAAQRSHAAHDALRFLAGEQVHRVIHWNEGIAADEHLPLFRKIKRHDRNALAMDVFPHVEFSPIGEGKDPQSLSVRRAGRCRGSRIPDVGSWGPIGPANHARRRRALWRAIFLRRGALPHGDIDGVYPPARRASALVFSRAQHRLVPRRKGLAPSFNASRIGMRNQM